MSLWMFRFMVLYSLVSTVYPAPPTQLTARKVAQTCRHDLSCSTGHHGLPCPSGYTCTVTTDGTERCCHDVDSKVPASINKCPSGIEVKDAGGQSVPCDAAGTVACPTNSHCVIQPGSSIGTCCSCSPVQCAMHCPHGFLKDAHGCNICKCKLTPKSVCPTGPQITIKGGAKLLCGGKNNYKCPFGSYCFTSKGEVYGACCVCPNKCNTTCPDGYLYGRDGCPTCECKTEGEHSDASFRRGTMEKSPAVNIGAGGTFHQSGRLIDHARDSQRAVQVVKEVASTEQAHLMGNEILPKGDMESMTTTVTKTTTRLFGDGGELREGEGRLQEGNLIDGIFREAGELRDGAGRFIKHVQKPWRTKQTQDTLDVYEFIPLNDLSTALAVRKHNGFIFRVLAESDAHVLLQTALHDKRKDTYEIILGGWRNTESVIRKGLRKMPPDVSVKTDNILSHTQWRTFWVSWENNIIRVGRGSTIGKDEIMRFADPFYSPVKYVSVATGNGIPGQWRYELAPSKPMIPNLTCTYGKQLANIGCGGANGYSCPHDHYCVGGSRRNLGGCCPCQTCTLPLQCKYGLDVDARGCDICDRCRASSSTSLDTLDTYEFILLRDLSRALAKTGAKGFLFSVKAKSDAHILLHENEQDKTNMYEIVLGGWANTQSAIRKALHQMPPAVLINTTNILSEYEWRPFWILWEGNTIRVGRGSIFGIDVIMEFTDPNPTPVRYVSVTTGQGIPGRWKYEIVSKPMIPGPSCPVGERVMNADGSYPVCAKSRGFSCPYHSYCVEDPKFPIGGCCPCPKCMKPCKHGYNIDSRGCENCGDCRQSSTTHLDTLDVHKYIPLRDLSEYLALTGDNGFVFSVQTPSDAHILLQNRADDTTNGIYEIVIGGWDNTQSVIKKGLHMPPEVSVNTIGELDANTWKQYWISWDNGIIRVGRGPNIGQRVFMEFVDPNYTPVKYISFSTGKGIPGRWKYELSSAGTRIETPIMYKYFLMRDFIKEGIPVNSLVFSVKAARDAHVLLHQHPDDTTKGIYEIVFGANGNTESFIRRSLDQTSPPVLVSTPDILNPQVWKTFWITWEGNNVRVGEGPIIGKRFLMEYSDFSPTPINYASVSTGAGIPGQWKYQIGHYCPECPNKCPYGYIKDEKGCDSCICKTPICPYGDRLRNPDGTYPVCGGVVEKYSCGPRAFCVPVKGEKFGACCECPKCPNTCKYGYVWDGRNCELCVCKPTRTVTENTPDMYRYTPLPDLEEAMARKQFVFSVKAANDAYVLLQKDPKDTKNNIYEIVLGAWNNKKSFIRKKQQQDPAVVEAVTDNIVSPIEFRVFWISWEGNTIKVGRGREVGKDIIMEYYDPNFTPINFASVSTGWGATGQWMYEVGWWIVLVDTPNIYYYITLRDVVEAMARKYFIFDVKASEDAHVLLHEKENDRDKNIYEIGIGTKKNTQSVIRKQRQQDPAKVTELTPGILSPEQWRRFWISWFYDTIRVGEGGKIGEKIIMEYVDPNPSLINFISVATSKNSKGKWRYESGHEPCPVCIKPCPQGYSDRKDAKGCSLCECKHVCPVCKRECPYGHVIDAYGCKTCTCKPPTCPAGKAAMKGTDTFHLCSGPEKYGCPPDTYCQNVGYKYGACCSCPPCQVDCPYGYIYDERGCKTCKCKFPTCPIGKALMRGGSYIRCGDTGYDRCPRHHYCTPVAGYPYGRCCPCPKCDINIKCPFGFIIDKNGCNSCQCKLPVCPGPAAAAAKALLNIDGSYHLCRGPKNLKCPPGSRCLAVPGYDLGACCPCPECNKFCPHGYIIDHVGCNSCECKPPTCPYGPAMPKKDGSYEVCKGPEKYACGADLHCVDIVGYDYGACCPCPPCKKYCPFGYIYEPYGCNSCKCKPPICPYGEIMKKVDGSYELCKGVENYACAADSYCLDIGGYDYGACCPCTPCKKYCPFGYIYEPNGCNSCKCKPPICPYGEIMKKGDGSYELCKGVENYACAADSYCLDIGGYDYGACCPCSPCKKYCPFGYLYEPNGCNSCKCKPPKCPSGKPMTNEVGAYVLCYGKEKYTCPKKSYCVYEYGRDYGSCCICPECHKRCKYGYEEGGGVCGSCKCKPPPPPKCPIGEPLIYYDDKTTRICGGGYMCPPKSYCLPTAGYTYGTCCSCPKCTKYCEHGYIKGKYGCDTCKCKPPPPPVCPIGEPVKNKDGTCPECIPGDPKRKCPEKSYCVAVNGKVLGACCPCAICENTCKYGYEPDKDGCDSCICKPEPTPECPQGYLLERPDGTYERCSKDPATGLMSPCPDQSYCSLVHGQHYGGCCTCPKFLCEKKCKYGFALDEYGCPYCECKRRAMNCLYGEMLLLNDAGMPVQCIAGTTSCPPKSGAVCRKHDCCIPVT